MTSLPKGGRTAAEEAAYQDRVAKFPADAHRDPKAAARLGLKQCWCCPTPRFVFPRKFTHGEVVLCPGHFAMAIDSVNCGASGHQFAATETADGGVGRSPYCKVCLCTAEAG